MMRSHSAHYAAGEKDVNLSPETTIELEQRNRNSFYDLNSRDSFKHIGLEDDSGAVEDEQSTDNFLLQSEEPGYIVRNNHVRNGFAYGGPRVKNLSDRAFTTFSANNAITLEGGSGDGEILLENETGVLQHPQSDSWSTTIADWNTLRFSGTLNSNVDGETMRLSDINGTNSSQNHRINFAFPTEVYTFKSGSIFLESNLLQDRIVLQDATEPSSSVFGIRLENETQ